MEGLVEVIVKKKMTFDVQVKRFVFTVLPLMAAIMLVRLQAGPIIRIVLCLAAAALCYLAYRMFLNFYIEWEYVFVTNEVSFSKIMNQSKRKDLITCQLKDTVIMFKNTDKERLSAIPKDAKKYNFLSGTGEDHYIWVTKDQKGRSVCIYFEPDERMLNCMRTLARSKIFI